MRVIVTGGAGYIGAHVARALRDAGHEPVVVDDLRAASARRVGDLAFENVSLEDSERLCELFARVRPAGVVHLAGSASVAESVRHPEVYWDNNLRSGASLLVACATHRIAKFLFSSTAAVYGNAEVVPIREDSPLAPTTPYGASKLAFERLLHATAAAVGFRSTALRYFNAAGANPEWQVGEEHDPEEHLIPRAIDALASGGSVQIYGDDYPTPDGTCVRDYVHVDDLAEAHVRVLEAEELASGRSFNVGTGRGYSVRQVIETVATHLGMEPRAEIRSRRPGDPPTLVADPTALTEQLRWAPHASDLDHIVATAVEWSRRRRSAGS
jgi:UDP-glucose-4-epimerase GalE